MFFSQHPSPKPSLQERNGCPCLSLFVAGFPELDKNRQVDGLIPCRPGSIPALDCGRTLMLGEDDEDIKASC